VRRDPLPLLVLALVAAIGAAYAGSLGHGFVFDDVKLVEQNPAIRDLRNVPEILAATFTYRPVAAREFWIDVGYRPVRMLSYALDHAIYGGLKAWGFRLTNLLLHALNAALVLVLIRRLLRLVPNTIQTGSDISFAPFCAAFFFALHPLQTEAVTYISGRRDVLFTAFYLGALILLLPREGGAGAPRPGRAAVAIVLFTLGLFTKEMAVTLPIAYLLVDRLLRRREERAPLALHALLFGVAAAYSLFVVLQKNPGSLAGESVLPIGGSRLAAALTMPRVVWHYVSLVVWPSALCADYSFDAFPATRGPLDPWTAPVAILGLVAAAAGTVALARRGRRAEAFALAFFGATLLPVLQIVPHPEPIAERYLYLPLAGAALLAGIGAARVRARGLGLGLALVILVGLALGIRTAVRNRDWKDDATLFASVVRERPRCARAQLAVGKGLLNAGKPREALDALDRCLEVVEGQSWDSRAGGTRVVALFERATARAQVGLHDLAVADFRRVLEERTTRGERVADVPGYAYVRLNLAATLKAKGEADAAAAEYARVVEAIDRLEGPPEPNAAAFRREALLQLGLLRLGRGAVDDGLARLREAAGPDVTVETERTHDVLGRALLEAGRAEEAERVFVRLALAPLPDRKAAWYRVADARRRRMDIPGARDALERAVAIDPKFAPGHLSLGELAVGAGDLDRAEAAFRAVLALAPGNRRALERLTEIGILRAAPDEAPRPGGGGPRRTPRERATGVLAGAHRLWSENQPVKAVEAAVYAAKIDPTFAAPRLLAAGWLLGFFNRPEEALLPLAQCVELLPDDAEVLEAYEGARRSTRYRAAEAALAAKGAAARLDLRGLRHEWLTIARCVRAQRLAAETLERP